MHVRVLFWILLAQAIGGSTPAITKLALAGLGPWSLVVVRQLLGTVILIAIHRLQGRRRGGVGPEGSPPPRLRELSARDWALFLTLAWAGFALPQVLNALGLGLSTATNGALLTPLEPIGILIGSALLLGERLTGARLGAVGLGIAGGVLIVTQSGVDAAAGDLRGDLLMALGHLSWAIYTLAAKPLVARHDPLRIAILASALSPLPLLPLAALEPFELARALPAMGWVLLLALLATALGTFAWNRALREVTAGTMAAFVFVQPVVGLAVGTLALGEPFGLQALAGAALIVGGVTLATLRAED